MGIWLLVLFVALVSDLARFRYDLWQEFTLTFWTLVGLGYFLFRLRPRLYARWIEHEIEG